MTNHEEGAPMNVRHIPREDTDADRRRSRRIRNIKTGGDLIMYIGSAGLMIPFIKKSQENQNGLMGACTAGAGAIIAIGLGNLTSKLLNKTVDKVVDFWDDVKPSKPAPKKEEETKNG